MDNQWNQQTNGGPYQQQGNPYQQQGNPYQQQGNPYQQGTPYMNNGYGSNGGSGGQQKAPNIFQQFVFAFVPTRYDRLTRVKTGSMIGFVTLLVLIATVLSFAFLAFGIMALDMEGMVEQLPDFVISDGHLHMDEEFLYDEDIVFVYITENIDAFSYEDADDLASQGYQDIILVGRDRISFMQNGEYQQIDFSDFGDSLEISRDWIVTTMAPLIMVVLAVAYVIIFLGKVLGYFLFAAVYLLFAMLIAAIMKKQLETGALFRVAVYSKVLMFVISTLVSLFSLMGFSVPFLIKVAATIGFMAFAIAKLPDNGPVSMPMPMGPGMGQWQNQGQGWR